ncbi:MAG TPA: SigB/SigF/SigG family RNA polymerase sigma factor [Acidimicrobiales bacterium]|nr:SigB/SigF/SigG family RNA polymerase sigma factor [Acidimicrobiales bacterium]
MADHSPVARRLMSGTPERVDSGDDKLREYSRSRDRALRDEIIEAHLDLVHQLARRFVKRSESYDDLVQAGSIGLIKAVDGFDPDLGFEFAAYASKTIVGELKRHFRDKGWSVRAPRRVQELYLSLGQVVDDLSQSLGRTPTVNELAEATSASEEEVLEALEAGHAYRSASLDTPGPEGEPLTSRLGEVDEAYTKVDERDILLPHIAELPERERFILHLRFVEDLTQSEIAERVGISQMHVSRLLARSLAKLHEAYGEE